VALPLAAILLTLSHEVASVRVLIEQIRGQSPVTSVRLPARLVVRESSGGGAAVPSAKGGSDLGPVIPSLRGISAGH